MPPRSSSRRKSNRQTKKARNLTTTTTTKPNHHSSPAVQSHGEVDLKILREQNGRNGNYPLRPNSEKCQCLVVEEEKKRFSVSAGHNEMEGSVEETQKVGSRSEDKQVIDVEEKVKSIVEFGAEVAAETHEGEDSNIVIQNEERSALVDSGKLEEIKEASEPIIDAIREIEDAESKLKENQEKDSEETERMEEKELPPSEHTTELSSALANGTSRETQAVETTEADEEKLASSEEKKELSSVETNEVLKNSDFSVPPTDLVSKAIEETTVVKPDETEETKLPAEEEKVAESTVVQESSKEEEAKESLQTSANVTAAETTSSTGRDKTEIPLSTESQTTVSAPQRQYTSWRSCCGIFDFLSR